MKPRVDYSDDGQVRIFHEDLLPGSFDIFEDRISTAPQLLGWISHLAGKRWVTADIIDQLITVCETHLDVNVNRHM